MQKDRLPIKTPNIGGKLNFDGYFEKLLVGFNYFYKGILFW